MDIQSTIIVGGSGGIGSALIKHLLEHSQTEIHATHYLSEPHVKHDRLFWHKVDVTDEAQVEKFAEHIQEHTAHIDWLINTVGFLHHADDMPEKALNQFDSDFFLASMKTNTAPTLLLAKHFLPLLKGDHDTVFASISAKVGSINDNRLGGWYSYRASKAALNMLLKTLSIEWQRSAKNICVAALHPGTTDTDLSKPFQRNVSPEKLFAPAFTAEKLVDVLNKLSPKESGQFWSWDGQNLPW